MTKKMSLDPTVHKMKRKGRSARVKIKSSGYVQLPAERSIKDIVSMLRANVERKQ